MGVMDQFSFPLVDSSYDDDEILSCIKTLLSGQLTMSTQVADFEQRFADHIGTPHAVMVNSGSSANLLSVAAVTNPARATRLRPGDAVAIPAVCWSTSLWPLTQLGLKPVLIDVDPETLNLSIDSLRSAVDTHAIRGVMAVHILGNAAPMDDLLDVCTGADLILIEDTCEALGSTFDGRYLGTHGAFGSFSFYFSHHMTTIEGGMVVTQTQEDADLLRTLRSHGWSRDRSDRDVLERANPEIDPRFLFVNAGFNVRPMELQAAFGLRQIDRLAQMNSIRRSNVAQMRDAFTSHRRWDRQLSFPTATDRLDPAWFGFPFLLNDNRIVNSEVASELRSHRIDTRPIVSGNMALQPAIGLFDIDVSLGPFVGAQRIHDRGLFIGAHSRPLDERRIHWLVDRVLAAVS